MSFFAKPTDKVLPGDPQEIGDSLYFFRFNRNAAFTVAAIPACAALKRLHYTSLSHRHSLTKQGNFKLATDPHRLTQTESDKLS